MAGCFGKAGCSDKADCSPKAVVGCSTVVVDYSPKSGKPRFEVAVYRSVPSWQC